MKRDKDALFLVQYRIFFVLLKITTVTPVIGPSPHTHSTKFMIKLALIFRKIPFQYIFQTVIQNSTNKTSTRNASASYHGQFNFEMVFLLCAKKYLLWTGC